jgi:hypothetical protein
VQKLRYMLTVLLILNTVALIGSYLVGSAEGNNMVQAYHRLSPEEMEAVDKFFSYLSDSSASYVIVGWMLIFVEIGLAYATWEIWHNK